MPGMDAKPPKKRGRGRPSMGEGESPRISLRVPRELLERVEAAAEAAGVPWQEWIRKALERATKARSS